MNSRNLCKIIRFTCVYLHLDLCNNVLITPIFKIYKHYSPHWTLFYLYHSESLRLARSITQTVAFTKVWLSGMKEDIAFPMRCFDESVEGCTYCIARKRLKKLYHYHHLRSIGSLWRGAEKGQSDSLTSMKFLSRLSPLW